MVVITAEHGVEFNDSGKGQWAPAPASTTQPQVPLVIHWPGTLAQTISKLTGHNDVMRTPDATIAAREDRAERPFAGRRSVHRPAPQRLIATGETAHEKRLVTGDHVRHGRR